MTAVPEGELRTEAGKRLLNVLPFGIDKTGLDFWLGHILAIEAEAAALDPDLAALRDLSEKATPGPWRAGVEPMDSNGVWSEAITAGPDEDGDPSHLVAWCHSDWRDDADAAFIVAAVNYVRERLRAKAGSAAG